MEFVPIFDCDRLAPMLLAGVRRESLLQDRLPVKFQDVKFTVPKCKHEIFVRIDTKHSIITPHAQRERGKVIDRGVHIL